MSLLAVINARTLRAMNGLEWEVVGIGCVGFGWYLWLVLDVLNYFNFPASNRIKYFHSIRLRVFPFTTSDVAIELDYLTIN
jgi:hypothetical protein